MKGGEDSIVIGMTVCLKNERMKRKAVVGILVSQLVLLFLEEQMRKAPAPQTLFIFLSVLTSVTFDFVVTIVENLASNVRIWFWDMTL